MAKKWEKIWKNMEKWQIMANYGKRMGKKGKKGRKKGEKGEKLKKMGNAWKININGKKWHKNGIKMAI